MTETETVDRIYEAAAVPELWPAILHKLAVQFGFEGGVLFTVNELAQRGIFSPGVEEVFSAFLRDGWASRSQRALRTIAKRHPGFIRDADLFTVEEKQSDPLYVELLRPRGFGDVAGTIVEIPNGDSIALSFERLQLNGETPLDVINAFDVLRPHIARAALFSGRLELEKARAQVAALTALGLPGAVVTKAGNAIAANEAFEALTSQISIAAYDRVHVKNASAAGLLSEALKADPGGPRAGRSIALSGVEGAAPAVLHVLPIRRAARDVFGVGVWLLVVTALGQRQMPSATLLEGLFDLTPAEARVARNFVDGLSVSEIAQLHDLSANTIRNQLQSIFGKTGMSRQSDLMKLLTSAALP